MNKSLEKEMYQYFLLKLKEILSDEKKIDIAVRDREGPHIDDKPIGISTLDEAGIFDANGEIIPSKAKDIHLTFNDLPRFSMTDYDLKSLSLRERIILDSVISKAHLALWDKYNDPNLVMELSPVLMKIPQIVLSDLRYSFPSSNEPGGQTKHQLMTSANSNKIHAKILQALNQGFYRFQQTNVMISPGPIAMLNENLHEKEQKLSTFLNNLKKNHVTHVFAIGRVLPYYPQDGKTREKINEVCVWEDFTNYFIPGKDGVVQLPSPEYDDFQVTSKVIEKIGRITTYEISINHGPPIRIHHFPLNDKQPLELDDKELAYIKHLRRLTPQDQNFLTHCRGGRGRSAQMAYILSANTPKYKEISSEEQLKSMRLEKCLDASSFSFVETEQQERYLFDLKPKLKSIDDSFEKHSNLDISILMDVLFRNELEQVKLKLGKDIPIGTSVIYIDSLTPEAKSYFKLLDIYHQLNDVSTTEDLFKLLEKAKILPCVSDSLKQIPTHDFDAFISHRLTEMLIQSLKSNERPFNQILIYDTIARHLSYIQAERILLDCYFKNQNPRNKIQYIDLNLCILHLNQAYLRQYKSHQEKMQQDITLIAAHLKTEIESISNFLNKMKRKYEANHALSGSDLMQWKHHEKYIATLKETLQIYEQNIGPLYLNDRRCLDWMNELEQTVRNGPQHESMHAPQQDKQKLDELRESLSEKAYQEALASTKKRGKFEQDDAETLDSISRDTQLARARLATVARDTAEAKQMHAEWIQQRLQLCEHKSTEAHPKATSKMIIFDVDDTLVDLDSESIKHQEALFNLIRSINNLRPQTEIAICTNRTVLTDQDPDKNGKYPLSRLVDEIQKNTGIVIKPAFQLLYSDDIRKGIEEIAEDYDRLNTDKIQEKRLGRLIQGKNYQLDELRLRYQAIHGTLPTESECVFVDDSQSIYQQTLETTNYQVVKVPDKLDDSQHYLVEIAYYMGLYDKLIKFLTNSGTRGYDSFNPDAIPNFKQMGFKKTPIVKDVSLKDFFERIRLLSGVEHQEKISEYKYDFTQAAIERFDSLSRDYKDITASDAFDYMLKEMQEIEEAMKKIVELHQPETKKWKQLLPRLEKLIALEKRYSEKIGLSYLEIDLYRLKTFLVADVSNLYMDENKFYFHQNPKNASSLFNVHHLQDKKHHSALAEKEAFKEQYQKYLDELDKFLCQQSVFEKDHGEDAALGSFLISKIQHTIENKTIQDIKKEYPNIKKLAEKLQEMKLQLDQLSKLEPYVAWLNQEKGRESQNNSRQLSSTLDQLFEDLKKDPEYKAMLFLEQAERFIKSPDRQWHKPPKHVIKQMDEIKAADKDGKYQEHMQQFIKIGRDEAKSFFAFLSSGLSKQYNKLFFDRKSGDASQDDLEKSFQNKPRNTQP